MKKIISFGLMAFLCSSFFPVTLAAQALQETLETPPRRHESPPPRRHIDFDNDWKFHLGNAADPSRDFNFSVANIFSKSGKADSTAIDPRFDDGVWRKVQLPHDWAVELPFENSPNPDVMAHGYKPLGGLYPQNSIGWYRKHFSIAASDSGQRFVIQFDGIFRDSKVWVNGVFAGSNLSGYSGACYDITDFVNFGRDNVIVVRVDATQYEGWYYEGAGIYRHVWLNQYNNLHIIPDGLFVHTEIQGDRAVVNVETSVINQGAGITKGRVSCYITDRDGKTIARSGQLPITLNANESRAVKQKLVLDRPVLWSPDNPYLYRVIPVISSADGIVDSLRTRFGIRSIRIDSGGLYVNGKYLKLKGVNCHPDHAGLGTALPDYLQYYRVHLLKALGANAYRTSHGAPTPELLDACDSLGMLVLDENRLLNSSPEYSHQFERLILRDRSRASVFLWSIGNEEGSIQTTSVGRRITQTLLQRQKELDPTRTCTYGADLANIFNGVNEVIPVRGFNYRIASVDAYHKDHPGQPIIGTEMGSTVTTRGIYTKDSVLGYLPDRDITAPWWANTAEQWWPLAAGRPWWTGGFVWTGFDYRGEPTPYRWPNINSHFGVMDICGFPKNIYYYYQSWWTDKDVLHISPHWNWKGKEGQPIDVWVNTNADNVELFLNGRSQGKKNMPRNKHLEWQIPFEAGVLEAVAFKGERKFTNKIETTGPPYEIVVRPSKTRMSADGKDAAVINISAVDSQGREVPDADNLVRFHINGDLTIIGVGNGDPDSHEPDQCADSAWQRHLFNGKCQVIVRAGNRNELIKFEAKAEGLHPGSTDIHTILPGSEHPIDVTALHFSNGSAGSTALRTDPTSLPRHEKKSGKILGADVSSLQELEDEGMKFSDKGQQKDALLILKDHGFNYIRLRIFNDPARDSGYSPKKGFCDLEHTKQMAKRIKAAGMKFLLDFFYSDYWTDPGKQYKPAAWRNEDFPHLLQQVFEYTSDVIRELKQQGTAPDMVQIGNEINNGMLWPDGRIEHMDSLAQLVYAGISGVKAVSPDATIILQLALGGQNDESRYFLDNMLARKVPFDMIGLSYYPKWHGTLSELQYNVRDLATRYPKDLAIVEYSELKKEINEIAFTAPGGKGKGTFIFEPMDSWERLFDKDGSSNKYLLMYDEIKKKFISGNLAGK